MVLDDTSPAGEGFIDADQPGIDEVGGIESFTATMLYCASLVAHQPLEPSKPEYKDCLKALPNDTPAAFRKIWPQFFTPYYFADKVSLTSSVYTHRYDAVDHLDLGAMPLVVLSPEDSWSDGTPAGDRFSQSYSKRWIAMHEALARLSSRGVHRYIRAQVTRFSWTSHRRSPTPWTMCSARRAPVRSSKAICASGCGSRPSD